MIGAIKMDIENKITNVEQLPLSLTVSDISQILNICKQSAYELCHSKDFPSIQIGRRLIITKPAFIEWLKNPKYN
jgi:hypothetical protein